jgi:hypothetical protein
MNITRVGLIVGIIFGIMLGDGIRAYDLYSKISTLKSYGRTSITGYKSID